MKQLFIFLLLPVIGWSQSGLSGMWRVTRTHYTKGPRYSNAIPVMIEIEEKAHLVTFKTTTSLGDKDTVVTEILSYGEHPGVTKSGKKKVVSFKKDEKANEWSKRVEVFSKDDENKMQSVNDELFRLNSDGTTLSLSRVFDAVADRVDEDFIVKGDFERVTPDQLARETAIGNGINFTEGLTWEQIKAKAKRESKYIFIDCYATWCAPCRAMDKYIYPLNIVGDAMNGSFISVKVQMDSTMNDANHIRMLYSLARNLEEDYGITTLPCYLFFSPDGKIVHKASGQYKALDFVNLITDSKNPEKQIYTLLDNAKSKKFPLTEYPDIIAKFQERQMQKEVFAVYYRDFLDKLSDSDLLTRANLDLIAKYSSILKSTDKIFGLCLSNPKLVSAAKGDTAETWAEYIVNSTIIREEIAPSVKAEKPTGKEPDWLKIQKRISKKYGQELAKTLVLGERVGYYQAKKNWVSYLRYVKPYISLLDLNKVSTNYIHYCAWFVFLYSDDKSLMNDALKWIDIVIGREAEDVIPRAIDSKACLLYKIGRTEDARSLLKNAIKEYPSFTEYLEIRLERIKNGGQILTPYEIKNL